MKITVEQMKQRMDLHAVANRLGIAEWPNRTGPCKSPLRPDSSESFSIFERKEQLFWKDHATGEGGDSISLIQHVKQCDPKTAILWLKAELGIVDEPRSKSGRTSNWENRELVCIYDYQDADGSILHQTLRYRDKETGAKTFLQRRRAVDGEKFGKYEAKLDRQRGGWWIWKLDGIEPVLYHLPEIASRSGDAVWIFEGEKDADNAAKLGLLTTTSPMGAGKWRESFSKSLAGREVVIVPDKDEPGTAHAVMVSKALAAAGCQVSVIRWSDLWPTAPEGKLDFTDWGEQFLRSSLEGNAEVAA
jgi:DNA primase